MTYGELNEKLRMLEDALVKIGYSAGQLKEMLPSFGITDLQPVEDILKISWHVHTQVIKKFEEEAHKILNPDTEPASTESIEG